MRDERHEAWRAAFREAPLAMSLLFLGVVAGAGAGVWLLAAVIGFDETPFFIAGPVLAILALAGGLAGVGLAVLVRRLSGLVSHLGRGRRKR